MTATEYEMAPIEDADARDKEPHATDTEVLLSTERAQPLIQPATLPRWATWEVIGIAIFDSFLVLLSALFLALAFVAKFLEGRVVTLYPYGQTIITFTRYVES